MEKLIDTIESIASPEIILVGDFMLDEYVYGDVERISPEAPVPILHVTDRQCRSGGAGNVATMIHALGGRVECIGMIGDDSAGNTLEGKLKNCGAGTSGLLKISGRPTVLKTRYVGLAQHKNPHQILRVDDENVSPLDPASQQTLLAAVKAKLADGACVTIQDHNKGLLSGDLAVEIISAARKKGCPVVVDPALIDDYSRYRGATILAPNRYEAQRATGIKINDSASLKKAAAKIAKITEAETVIITLDREGSFLYQRAAKGKGVIGEIIPAAAHEVADGTGAGDAVTSMLSIATGSGCESDKAVALANVAGGLEVEFFGVVAITREQIIEELRRVVGLRRSKIMTRERLAEELTRRRRSGANVVFTNGCFDLLHMGHVQYLQQARQLGTCLVLAINSDDSIRRLKGPQRPILCQDERAQMLAALECIDYVTVFDEDTPEALLELFKPDILVKGGSTDVIVGQEFVESYGGKVSLLELVQGRSTTNIINNIIEMHDKKTGDK